MISRGRPTITEAEIADAAGVPLSTWRRREAPALRAHVSPVHHTGRLRVYDLAQVEAYRTGQPLPEVPADPPPHPDDLLTAGEVAAQLAITVGTVEAYTATGYLHGLTRHGARWYPRHEIDARRAAGDQRHASPQRQTAQARVAEVAAAIEQAEAGHRQPVTAAELQQRYGITERTAQRTLAAARRTRQTPAEPPTDPR